MTGPLVPAIHWPGSGSDPTNANSAAPFGWYVDDDEYVEDAPKVAEFVALSLGYPVMEVELTDKNIYSQFEQAISEFSSMVHEFIMREQMLTMQGMSTGSSLTGVLLKTTPLPYVVEISQMYGTEAGVGGLVDFKKGYVTLNAGQQDYDLQHLWAAVSESGNRIEVRRIYHDRTPAVQKFFDPFAGGASYGVGTQNLLNEFGFGNYSIASQFLLMPVYETLLRVQAIELNDQIRRSQYSFELKNNKLRIFPIPNETWTGAKLWFEYLVTNDKWSAMVGAPGTTGSLDSSDSSITAKGGVVTDFSNAPFDFIQYSNINDVGKRWILKYTLALCKILLGNIRAKYDQIPIPNDNIRMDGQLLRTEGYKEKDLLTTLLRETLVETGRKAQMAKMAEAEEQAAAMLARVPLGFYIM